MDIKTKISKLAKDFVPRNPVDIAKKIEYSKSLSDKGILKKNTYDLPQVDTLGKSYYCDLNRVNS